MSYKKVQIQWHSSPLPTRGNEEEAIRSKNVNTKYIN